MSDFANSHNISIEQTLLKMRDALDLNQIEISTLKSPFTIRFYEKWLSQNYHGQMAYLLQHLPYKQNPRLLDERIKSVISLSQSYFPAVSPHQVEIPARTATYAKNHDYHFWLKEKLLQIISILQKNHPQEVFLPYVDSGPLLERDLAFQNGLGWFGKNTCLIHPKQGSLFFIAEILTSLELPENHPPIEPLPDFCGTCTKCIEACPTQAIESPRVLNAEKCISYLTIESKKVPPVELRAQIQDWFFGCDICQTVCPWNQKIFKKRQLEKHPDIQTNLKNILSAQDRQKLVEYFRFLLTSSHKQIQKYHHGTALHRAGAKGLKRNALVVIANQKIHELEDEVAKIQDSYLSELAMWCLAELKKTECRP